MHEESYDAEASKYESTYDVYNDRNADELPTAS